MEQLNRMFAMEEKVSCEKLLRVLYGIETEDSEELKCEVMDALMDLSEEGVGGMMQAVYLWSRYLLGMDDASIMQQMNSDMESLLHKVHISGLRRMRHPRYAKRILKAA